VQESSFNYGRVLKTCKVIQFILFLFENKFLTFDENELDMALLDQLKLLVNLARIDGDMAEREKSFITNIGKANGFPESSVATLFYQTHEVIIPDNLTDDQRFNYIFSLVQLMKIDERIYQDEIKFCAKIAARLGYSQDVLFDLMLKVKSTLDDAERKAIQEFAQGHLRK